MRIYLPSHSRGADEANKDFVALIIQAFGGAKASHAVSNHTDPEPYVASISSFLQRFSFLNIEALISCSSASSSK